MVSVRRTRVLRDSVSEATDWSTFEMGKSPVYWDAKPTAVRAACKTNESDVHAEGKTRQQADRAHVDPKTKGELLTIYFNPKVNNVLEGESIAFNGGFNGPFMCGGAPRPMTKKDRGPACDPLYSIRINVPKHALWLEFSFTDGQEWDEGYKLKFLVPENHRGQSLDFFNQELAKEMSEEDACYHAIFPDAVSEPDSLFLGGSMSIGMSCDLDVVPGCRDPDSPNYDPFATIDDDTCEEEF